MGAVIPCPLPHAYQAEPNGGGILIQFWHPFTIVSNLQGDLVLRNFQGDIGQIGLCVSGYVGEGLLHDPEDICSEVLREFGQRIKVESAKRGLSSVEVLNKGLKTCRKSDMVQKRQAARRGQCP